VESKKWKVKSGKLKARNQTSQIFSERMGAMNDKKKVERFEDLIAWQKARGFVAEIYRATNIGEFARDWDLRGQLRRSAVSVMSNISEGFERNRPREFYHFLSISKGSCGEARSQLYVALDAKYLSQSDFDRLRTQAEEVSRIISGLRDSVESRIEAK
jgi:four helix bundle protein